MGDTIATRANAVLLALPKLGDDVRSIRPLVNALAKLYGGRLPDVGRAAWKSLASSSDPSTNVAPFREWLQSLTGGESSAVIPALPVDETDQNDDDDGATDEETD